MGKAKLKILVSRAQLLGERENQEDAFGVSTHELYQKTGVLLAVLSDGMGGMERGEVYSQNAVQCMLRDLEEEDFSDPRLWLARRYQMARGQAKTLRKSEEQSDGGATMVAVLISERRCSFLSVGDSRVYLLRGGGLIQLNREQSLGPMLDERAVLGIIPEEVASKNKYRETLLNHTNADSPILCELCREPFALVPGDKIALMSDGVFGTLSEGELTVLLGRQGKLAAQKVAEAIQKKKAPRQDNATLLLLEIKGS